MTNQLGRPQKILLIAGAAVTWLAVILQLYLIILNRKMPLLATLVQFFSFFTILTNILVALFFTGQLVNATRTEEKLSRPGTATAIAVYILVVGLVYNLVLRPLWNPQGLQLLVDELLHSVNPLLFLVYWFLYVPKAGLQWKDSLPWLAYPLIYLAYILLRGSMTGLYPYPFVDVTQLGPGKVAINCLALSIGFLLLSLLFIGITKLMGGKKDYTAVINGEHTKQ